MNYVGVINLDMGMQEVAVFSAEYLADNWALEVFHSAVVAEICNEIPDLEPVRFETMAEGRRWLEQVEDDYHDTHRDFLAECTFDYRAYPRGVNTATKIRGKVVTLFFDKTTEKVDWARYTRRRPGNKKGAV